MIHKLKNTSKGYKEKFTCSCVLGFITTAFIFDYLKTTFISFIFMYILFREIWEFLSYNILLLITTTKLQSSTPYNMQSDTQKHKSQLKILLQWFEESTQNVWCMCVRMSENDAKRCKLREALIWNIFLS